MKIQFLTIATLALATSTVSAYSCPKNPTQTVGKACMKDWLEAAHCNCRAFASIESGSCFVGCTARNPLNACSTGCAQDLAKNRDECKRMYDNFKANGGGIHWIAEMQVKGDWCISG